MFSIVLVVGIVVGGLKMASNIHKPKPAPPTTQQIWATSGIPVQTSTIVRGNMEETAEVNGDITALNSATLSAKIPGRVTAVLVREGDRVSAGQTVAILDQDDPRSNLQTARGGLQSALARLSQAKTNARVTKIQTDAAIEQAQANLEAANSKLKVAKRPTRTQEQMVAENRVVSAKANLENALSNYKRNAILLKEGAIAPSTFDPIKSQYTVAKADYQSALEQLSMIKEGGRSEDVSAAASQVAVVREELRTAKANASQNLVRAEDIKSAIAGVEQAKAAVAMAEQQLANTYIKSPISGEIASRSVDPGNVVGAGQQMVTVVNMGSVYFKGDISENALENVVKGQRVRVHIDAIPGESFTGSVTQIYPAGSTSSRNFSVRISINQATRKIKPGMFARGEILTGISRNALLVPKDALDERKGTKSVFTVDSNKSVKRHIVDVVRENRDFVELRMPVDFKPTDTVVTEGRQNLQDGSRILINNGK